MMKVSSFSRPLFKSKSILLVGEQQRETALLAIMRLPADPISPLEIVIREKPKARTLDQNAAMWAGPLRDIAEQAWVSGRQFSAAVWHEHFKRLYLPENDDPDLARLVKDPETWSKWDYTPAVERILVGSTTELSAYGFGQYLEQIEADGASMGVSFRVAEGQWA